jgi:hypothetical protein
MLKLELINQTATDVTVAVIGTIEQEYLPELEAVIAASVRDHRHLAFDLSQVRLAGRETVAFFVTGEGRRAHLEGCPAYLREWLKSENRRHL